jgi:hypothetical protein
MLNKKEIIVLGLVTIVLAFSISLLELTSFFQTLLMVFLILIINISAKKIASFYLDSKIEIKLWEISRYGFKTYRHFKKPFPAGAFLPIISKILLFPFKNLVWMASLVFDVKPKVYRAAKRHGFYSFSEITEKHMGIIAAAGITATLFSSLIGYLLNFPDFARLSIYYALFNMIPVSDLDGNKIFFGSLVLWSFLAALVLLGLLFAIFII